MIREDYYSYSRLRTFDHCNRYYYYHYELGLPTKPSFEAEYSSILIHPAIAALYKGDSTFNFDNQWAKLQAVTLENPAPRILNLDKAITMAAHYWQQFGLSDMETHSLLCIEEKLFDDDQEFQSIPDLVLKAYDTDILLVLDHKVSTYEPKPILSSFNRQLVSQAITLANHFAFELRDIWIGINYFSLQMGTVTRQIIPLDLNQCREYNDEYETKRLQIVSSRQGGVWSKNAPDACVKFYGRKKEKCEFWALCMQGVPRPPTPPVPESISVVDFS